ncbi:ArsR family transcriptional regulator [Deinococcus malanensis]|uniref:ArsR family transcriptional regulator n=1 Tax=Deinococcus malanensis TaxID=1706855 RepID=UPI0036436021
MLEFLLRVEEARRRGECFAGTISQALGLSQPTISHHMKVLVDAGLVKATKKAPRSTTASATRAFRFSTITSRRTSKPPQRQRRQHERPPHPPSIPPRTKCTKNASLNTSTRWKSGASWGVLGHEPGSPRPYAISLTGSISILFLSTLPTDLCGNYG